MIGTDQSRFQNSNRLINEESSLHDINSCLFDERKGKSFPSTLQTRDSKRLMDIERIVPLSLSLSLSLLPLHSLVSFVQEFLIGRERMMRLSDTCFIEIVVSNDALVTSRA